MADEIQLASKAYVDAAISGASGLSLLTGTVTAADLAEGPVLVATCPAGGVLVNAVLSDVVETADGGNWIVKIGTAAGIALDAASIAGANTTAAFDSDLWRDAGRNGIAESDAVVLVATDDLVAGLVFSGADVIVDAVPGWLPSHVYAAGAQIIVADPANSNTLTLWVTTAGGTSGLSLPVFDASSFTVSDGTVSWDVWDIVPTVGSATLTVLAGVPT